MSYVGPPGGQRPDPSRYYSPQVPGGAPAPSYTPSFHPTPAAYMSPTVHPTPAQYASPPPANAAQFVRQPSFVPDTKAAAKGPNVDFSFDPRAGSAVPPHLMNTASRSSSGSGFPTAPQHAPSFGPTYPQQVVNPAQYASAPGQNPATLVRQTSIVAQMPSYPAAVRGSVGGAVTASPSSPSALPLPQGMPQNTASVSTHYATAPPGHQSAQFAPVQPQTFGGHQQPPSPVALAPTFSPISPNAPVMTSMVGAPVGLPPVSGPSPAYAAPTGPPPDVQRQIAETIERARQAEENAVRLKAQLDESHKQFQELVSKQSKLELGSQSFSEQQRKAEEDIKQLSEKLRISEEKSAALERHATEVTPQLNALNEKAAANEKRALAAEERLKAGDDKLRHAEERARKAEDQALLLSSTASQGNSTLAQQMAMREALEAALKEANDRLSKADGIWQGQNQRIHTLEQELQQWRHQGPAKDLELQAALTREKTLKEALDVARKQAADSQALVGNRTQEALLQLEQRNAELAAAHQREAELKRLLEQRGPDSGSSAKTVELQAKLDAKTAELATAAKREQAFREALEKAKKNLTDADTARAALEEDLLKAEENVTFFRAMAKTNEEMAAAAEAKLEKAIAVSMGQPFAPAEAPSANSVLDGIRARIAALNTGGADSTTEALAELDGL